MSVRLKEMSEIPRWLTKGLNWIDWSPHIRTVLAVQSFNLQSAGVALIKARLCEQILFMHEYKRLCCQVSDLNLSMIYSCWFVQLIGIEQETCDILSSCWMGRIIMDKLLVGGWKPSSSCSTNTAGGIPRGQPVLNLKLLYRDRSLFTEQKVAWQISC